MGKPTLRIVRSSDKEWVYYGDVRLPLCIVGDALEFRVKETWLRGEYGECVAIPLAEFVELVGLPLYNEDAL